MIKKIKRNLGRFTNQYGNLTLVNIGVRVPTLFKECFAEMAHRSDQSEFVRKAIAEKLYRDQLLNGEQISVLEEAGVLDVAAIDQEILGL